MTNKTLKLNVGSEVNVGHNPNPQSCLNHIPGLEKAKLIQWFS